MFWLRRIGSVADRLVRGLSQQVRSARARGRGRVRIARGSGWLVAVLVLFGACRADSEPSPPKPEAPEAAPVPQPPPPPPIDPLLEGLSILDTRIESSLEAAVVAKVGKTHGPALAQVAKRVLVWWVSPTTDLRKGDRLELVYRIRENGEEPEVKAIWFRSEKLGETKSAVRYQPEGARWERWYAPDGKEVELRLVGGPIKDYEQVTSLLRDGRRHRGVDFKTDVGTPIYAPFSGRIVRRNWSFRGNGNSLDIQGEGGMHALLLHLSSIDRKVRRGSWVKKGQLIAKSGNTGRSTAPHLHYQLERANKRIVDPFRFHKTQRFELDKGEWPELRARLGKYATLRTGQPDA